MTMTIRKRLNLVLCVMMLLAVFIVGICTYVVAQQRVAVQGLMVARLHMATGQAVRRYTAEYVHAVVAAEADAFHTNTVPSFAANKTLGYLRDAYPDLTYREVASNPTNPVNRAQGWEDEALRTFRAKGAERTELMHREGRGEQERLLLAKPLVATQSCLQCHSAPHSAPPAMVRRYGKDHGYGWKLGDVIGAQVVSVSLQTARSDAWWSVVNSVALATSVCVLFFLGLNIALRRVVLSPIQTSFRNYRRMAATDMLTALANRREFMARTEAAVRRAERSGKPLSVIVLDIDHFKRLNDTHGHAAGDDVLRELGRCLNDSSKRRDLPARLGGEEFVVLLPGSHMRHARRFAEALCKTIANKRFSHVSQVTASFGVAQRNAGESTDALLKRADDALYLAKQGGRNCVRCAE